MDSPHDDAELHDWLRWAEEPGNTPEFVRTIAEAALIACTPDYQLIRPMLVELKRQHPEPQSGPGWRDDPELRDWLWWVSKGGNLPHFARALVEAAFCACAGNYKLLRPALNELKRRYPIWSGPTHDGEVVIGR